MQVEWRFHKDGEFINNLKTKAHRDASFREWIRTQKCFCCPNRGDSMVYPITCSHILRGYNGLKNHDWASVPMCGSCHWLYEYHREEYTSKWREPTLEDANKYYLKYLQITGKPDLRTPEQMVPL